jgi:hypothetical protein
VQRASRIRVSDVRVHAAYGGVNANIGERRKDSGCHQVRFSLSNSASCRTSRQGGCLQGNLTPPAEMLPEIFSRRPNQRIPKSRCGVGVPPARGFRARQFLFPSFGAPAQWVGSAWDVAPAAPRPRPVTRNDPINARASLKMNILFYPKPP